jgi:hypothetical protein
MDSLVLQTVIGLVFVFAVFAGLVSVITETISRLMGLRGEYLLRGLRSLLDGKSHFAIGLKDLFRRTPVEPAPKTGEPGEPWVTRVMEHPLVAGSADQAEMPGNAGNAKLSSRQRRRLPSYISSRSFTVAMMSELLPSASGPITMAQVKTAVDGLPAGPPKKSLLALVDAAASDVDTFRTLLQQWFDDHMARVSGWYKRHVRWISLGIAAFLVVAFNLSAVQITRALYTDQALNSSVVTTATNASQCQDKNPAVCLRDLRAEIQQVRGAGLPIGWSAVPACPPSAKCGWAARYGLADPTRGPRDDVFFFLLLLIGWGLMVAAILPGARFWFDALSRLGSLRSSGPKPASS